MNVNIMSAYRLEADLLSARAGPLSLMPESALQPSQCDFVPDKEEALHVINTFSRWRGCTVIAVAFMAMLAAVSLGGAAPAAAAPAAASPAAAVTPGTDENALPRLPPPEPDCSKQFAIYSARGSQETWQTDEFGDNHINSRYVNAVSDLITTHGVSSGDIAQYNVKYTADGFLGYSGAVDEGAQNLEAEIHKNAACGPNRPTLILIGYSEGAHVIKQTLNDIASSPDADIIGAAINIGDPSRFNSQPPLTGMTTVNPDWTPAPPPDSTASGGVVTHLPVSSPFADDGRYFDLCRVDDPDCNAPIDLNNPEAQQIDNLIFVGLHLSPAHMSYNQEPPGGAGDQMAQRATAAAEAQHNKTNPPPPPPPASTHPASAEPPATVPPATTPPVTVPPMTVPSATVPPVTTPSATVPPVTTPSATVPPVTTPSATVPSVTTPSATVPPVTVPPATVPPVTTPPVTMPPVTTPPPGSVPPAPPVKGVPGPTVYQERAWGREMNIRQFATTDSNVIHVLHGPTMVDVQCQVHGQRVIYGPYDNDGWSYLPAHGGWLSNIFITGNGMVPRVPDCGSPQAPNVRADVPHVLIPKAVTPAPEVLRPFQPPTAPSQPPSGPAPAPTQTPTAPSRPTSRPAPAPAQRPTAPSVGVGNIGLP